MTLPYVEASAIAQTVLGHIAGGDFAAVSQRFVNALQHLVPPETLELVWKQILSEAGPLRRIEASQPEPAEDPELCLVTSPCAFERGSVLARMLIDTEGRLNGMWFHAKES